MITIDIPGRRTLNLMHLVLDFNGTIAVDGQLVPGVADCLAALVPDLDIHVLTADTFGMAAERLAGVDCRLSILPAGCQDETKLEYVKTIGCGQSVCIGNGRNDCLMLREAGLGIAVALQEGVALETVLAADVICTDIVSALELLRRPLRLKATLRV
jgi:soluble P-type ATPase